MGVSDLHLLALFGDTSTYVTALGVFTLAYTIYSLFGFGSGLITVGIMSMLLPIQDVIVMTMLVNVPVELWVLSRNWKNIPWASVIPIFLAVAISVPVGAHFLAVGRPDQLMRILGAVLAVAGVAFLIASNLPAVKRRVWVEPLVGMASGVLGGMFGTGGPPLLIYFQLSRFDKARFRSALIAIFHGTSWVRITTYALNDLVTVPRVAGALCVLPALLAGVLLGTRLHVGISEQAFRRAVSVALVVLGAMIFLGR